MKRFVFLMLSSVILFFACTENEKFCPDKYYTHRALSYIELKQGMTFQFSSLDNLAFVTLKSDPSKDGKKTSDDEPSTLMYSSIVSPLGKKDFLYPGIIAYCPNIVTYDTIYNQTRYEEMCDEVGDHINEKFCFLSPVGGILDNSQNLYMTLLYNKLDSLRIVCVDKNFGSYPVGSSLNDTFNMRCVIVYPKVSYKDRSLVLPKNDKTNKPYMFDAKLKDFYTITGGGARFINVIDWSPEGYTMVINTTSPRIYLSGEGRANKEAYRFKLFFYMDDGKLVVESNEIVGYY